MTLSHMHYTRMENYAILSIVQFEFKQKIAFCINAINKRNSKMFNRNVLRYFACVIYYAYDDFLRHLSMLDIKLFEIVEIRI